MRRRRRRSWARRGEGTGECCIGQDGDALRVASAVGGWILLGCLERVHKGVPVLQTCRPLRVDVGAHSTLVCSRAPDDAGFSYF